VSFYGLGCNMTQDQVKMAKKLIREMVADGKFQSQSHFFRSFLVALSSDIDLLRLISQYK
jgi:Arc/MetJ-type ribon-helix-helix transcriptional regulator